MITLHWDSELEAVIVWEITEGWTWDDFHNAIDRCWDMIEECQPTANTSLILMMPDSMRFPAGSMFASIGHGMREIAKLNGYVVVVAQNRFHTTVISMIRRVTPEGVRLFPAMSLDDARTQVSHFRSVEEGAGRLQV